MNMNNSALIQATDRTSKRNLRSALSEGQNIGNGKIWLQLGFELGKYNWLSDNIWTLHSFDSVDYDSSRSPHYRLYTYASFVFRQNSLGTESQNFRTTRKASK